MSEDNIKAFPQRSALGVRAMAATLESELDAGNPLKDSLRGLLQQRQQLILQCGDGDGPIREKEREITERLSDLAGMKTRHQ